MAAATIFLAVLPLLTAIAAVNNSSYHPTFQRLNVKETIQVTSTRPSPQVSEYHEEEEEDGDENNWTMKVLHREQLFSGNSGNDRRRRRLDRRLKRDAVRAASLIRRLASAGGYGVDDFGTDVVSGMDQGSGEYFVRMWFPTSNSIALSNIGESFVVKCRRCELRHLKLFKSKCRRSQRRQLTKILKPPLSLPASA